MAQLIDAPQSNLDRTVRIFDQFYNFDLVINADQYEIVYSYFLSITNDASTARNFTSIMFRISNITGEDVFSLLDYMKNQTSLDPNAVLVYYLNSTKSKTTLFGLSNVPEPNPYVQRNVVQ